MKTIKLEKPVLATNYRTHIKIIVLFSICLLAQFIPVWLQNEQPNLILLDQSIWQLWLFAIFSFAIITVACWLLVQWIWLKIGLPKINTIVSHFKLLTPWQQFVMYWASYALLFLGALLSLAAIF